MPNPYEHMSGKKIRETAKAAEIFASFVLQVTPFMVRANIFPRESDLSMETFVNKHLAILFKWYFRTFDDDGFTWEIELHTFEMSHPDRAADDELRLPSWKERTQWANNEIVKARLAEENPFAVSFIDSIKAWTTLEINKFIEAHFKNIHRNTR